MPSPQFCIFLFFVRDTIQNETHTHKLCRNLFKKENIMKERLLKKKRQEGIVAKLLRHEQNVLFGLVYSRSRHFQLILTLRSRQKYKACIKKRELLQLSVPSPFVRSFFYPFLLKKESLREQAKKGTERLLMNRYIWNKLNGKTLTTNFCWPS